MDPLKDQQAQQMAVRNGFKSRAEVVSEMGYDVEEIDQEIAEDQRRASELGLSFDSDVTANQEVI
nr:head, portal protein B [Wolbachia phage WO]